LKVLQKKEKKSSNIHVRPFGHQAIIVRHIYKVQYAWTALISPVECKHLAWGVVKHREFEFEISCRQGLTEPEFKLHIGDEPTANHPTPPYIPLLPRENTVHGG